MMERDATFSESGTYRYTLYRRWKLGPLVMWLMLNPSTADANIEDPTIRRCIRFSQEWGYGGLLVGNLYALRSTDPKALKSYPDPVGARNDFELVGMAEDADLMIVGAWGANGNVMSNRVLHVQNLLPRMHCLGLDNQPFVTKEGHPRHPLYVQRQAQPVLWPELPYPEGWTPD